MRFITRADFDGIVCGVLITAKERIDRFAFVEPKSMQDGEVPVDAGDIIANLPNHPDCYLWFDHHVSNRISTPFHGSFQIAPSAARVVFDFYSGTFLKKYEELVIATDRIDSGNLDMTDILHPEGYVLLSFTITPSIQADESYWIRLIHLLRDQPFTRVKDDIEVKNRCRQVLDDFKVYGEILRKNSRKVNNIVITDFRDIDFKGKENRFLIYSLFPDTNLSVKIFTDLKRPGRTGISVGKNIFNKTSKLNLGKLMTRYGGGGHDGAASTRVPAGEVDRILAEMIDVL